jgi:hypothetical protein
LLEPGDALRQRGDASERKFCKPPQDERADFATAVDEIGSGRNQAMF